MGDGSAFRKAAPDVQGERLVTAAIPLQSEQFDSVSARFREAQRPVVLAGAGMDTSSGLPLLRDKKSGVMHEAASGAATNDRLPLLWGLWDRYRRAARHAPLSPAHKALARWQSAFDAQGSPDALTVITTSTSGLHQRAGLRRVIDLHGSCHLGLCLGPKAHQVVVRDSMFSEVGSVPMCPECERPLRPHVILDGEDVRTLEREVTEAVVAECDLLVVAGTSGRSTSTMTVVDAARALDVPVVLINDEPWTHGLPITVGASGDVAAILPMVCPSP